jgi:hypothetical protein
LGTSFAEIASTVSPRCVHLLRVGDGQFQRGPHCVVERLGGIERHLFRHEAIHHRAHASGNLIGLDLEGHAVEGLAAQSGRSAGQKMQSAAAQNVLRCSVTVFIKGYR